MDAARLGQRWPGLGCLRRRAASDRLDGGVARAKTRRRPSCTSLMRTSRSKAGSTRFGCATRTTNCTTSGSSTGTVPTAEFGKPAASTRSRTSGVGAATARTTSSAARSARGPWRWSTTGGVGTCGWLTPRPAWSPSRVPKRLSAVGRLTSHAGQNKILLTITHEAAAQIKRLIVNVRTELSHALEIAPQFDHAPEKRSP